MIAPEEPKKERERLLELESYGIMDTESQQDFDRITELASDICGTKISLISLLDDKRQWFKSKHGLAADETPKEISFCGHAINSPEEAFIVKDARKDERFFDNPLVTGDPHVIFYSGIPIVTDSGYPLGTLCVIDDEPKELNTDQLRMLRTLSKQAMRLLDLHKRNRELEQNKENLQYKNRIIEHFTALAASDLKSPLKNIDGYIKLIRRNENLGDDVIAMLTLIGSSKDRLETQIKQLLEFSRVDQMPVDFKSVISPSTLLEEVKVELNHPDYVSIKLQSSVQVLDVNVPALKLVLNKVLCNAIIHNNKPEVNIRVSLTQTDSEYKFVVLDNGPGIDSKKINSIFNPFEVHPTINKQGQRGTGLGLAIAKRLVERMGGSILASSEPNKGTVLTFFIRKSKYTAKKKKAGMNTVNIDIA